MIMTTKSGSISLTKISWLQTKPLWGFPAGLASDSLLGATTVTQGIVGSVRDGIVRRRRN